MNRSDLLQLGAELEGLGPQLIDNGETLWDRTQAWTKAVLPVNGTRGGGTAGGASDDQLTEILGDRAAARYHEEVKDLAKRMQVDARRMKKLITIACPEQPKQLGNRDLLAAQVAAEGWCVSCHRDGGHLEPVWADHFRDACRFCGEWRAAHDRQWPTLKVIRWRHRHPGKHVPLSVVEAN